MIGCLRNIVLIIALILLSGELMKAHTQENEERETPAAQEEEYTLDPTISGEIKTPHRPSTTLPATIEKRKGQTRIQLESEGRVTPYLGAGTPPPPAKEVVPLLSEEERAAQKNIHLETGVGVNVTENTNFSLGYRLKESPTLLDEQAEDNGQLRFGIDFQLPTK